MYLFFTGMGSQYQSPPQSKSAIALRSERPRLNSAPLLHHPTPLPQSQKMLVGTQA